MSGIVTYCLAVTSVYDKQHHTYICCDESRYALPKRIRYYISAFTSLYFLFFCMQALAELLPLLMKGGHRVLIFSQWTTMLDILEWTLEVVGVTYRRLDGR